MAPQVFPSVYPYQLFSRRALCPEKSLDIWKRTVAGTIRKGSIGAAIIVSYLRAESLLVYELAKKPRATSNGDGLVTGPHNQPTIRSYSAWGPIQNHLTPSSTSCASARYPSPTRMDQTLPMRLKCSDGCRGSDLSSS